MDIYAVSDECYHLETDSDEKQKYLEQAGKEYKKSNLKKRKELAKNYSTVEQLLSKIKNCETLDLEYKIKIDFRKCFATEVDNKSQKSEGLCVVSRQKNADELLNQRAMQLLFWSYTP